MDPEKSDETKDPRLELLSELIADLKEAQALDELEKLMACGISPGVLLSSCMEGMHRVGKRFEEGRYFIAALIMAGEIMRQATERLGPHLSIQKKAKTKGRFLLGTVQGDIHDLGKNLFAGLLHFDGVEVVDLGVDVPPEVFVTEVERRKPDMVGLSCVLTSCLSGLKDTIDKLRTRFGDGRPPVIIGGACVDAKIGSFTKADFWAPDAAKGLQIYRKIFAEGFKSSRR